MIFKIDGGSKEPIYKQLVAQVKRALHDGSLPAGEQIPSMNDLSAKLGISRETVKKAYGVLVENGLIVPKHGKGFYAADLEKGGHPQVLVIFDKFSVYKQILFNAFSEKIGDRADITIVNHNQSLDLLTYYLDNYLDEFDYYVVTPHFPLDSDTQAGVLKQLARIPNRKLIMLDRLQPDYPGNYGAVYQDFESDIYDGLAQGFEKGAHTDCRLRVITLPESLYGSIIRRGVERFCKDYEIPVSFYYTAPEDISRGDIFLVLNSQLDEGLVSLVRKISAWNLSIGDDVKIISYNEFPMNELVLGGLTTVSTDFWEMGRLAADMITGHKLGKLRCPFRMNRRHTF